MDGKASGTSRDLKLQFGLGYQLQLQFQEVPDTSDVEACGSVPVCAHLPAILMSFRARWLGVVQRHIHTSNSFFMLLVGAAINHR